MMIRNIFLLLIGFTTTQIVVCQDLNEAPHFDSIKIAFVSYKTGSAEIFLMNADGSSVEQITSSIENNSFPYQIDERTIGFTRIDSLRNTVKYKIDIYTKNEEPVIDAPIRICAKWQIKNTNDRHWAFIRSSDYRDRELFIFDYETGMEKQLTSHQKSDFAAYSINHSWSPNNEKLVFMSGPDWYNQYIRIYDLKNDSIYSVTKRGYMNSGLKWLKDSKTLIANLKIKDESMYEIYSVDSSTGEMQQLTTGISLHPDISPDGEWIVFESQRHNNDGEVYIMKKDGSNQRRLTNNPNYNGRCIWFKK